MTNGRQMNFRKLISAAVITLAAIACKKNDDGTVTPSDELDGGRFWTLDEIKAAMGKEMLTPNFEMEFVKVMEWMGF